MPYHRLYFSAIAMRSAELPQVTAYWLMLPWIAAQAASFIGSGIGKSGNPCARFTASCRFAMRVISRITDSVKVTVRLAASIEGLEVESSVTLRLNEVGESNLECLLANLELTSQCFYRLVVSSARGNVFNIEFGSPRQENFCRHKNFGRKLICLDLLS